MIRKKWICRICQGQGKKAEFRTIRGIAKHICTFHFDLWKMVIKLKGYVKE